MNARLLISLAALLAYAPDVHASQDTTLVLRVVAVEAVESFTAGSGMLARTFTPASGNRFVAVTLQPTGDGGFNNDGLVLIAAVGGQTYRYLAVSPKDPIWIAAGGVMDLDRTDITFHYEGDKSWFEFNSVDRASTVSWTGSGARLKVLFEVNKPPADLRLRHGNRRPVPLSPR